MKIKASTGTNSNENERGDKWEEKRARGQNDNKRSVGTDGRQYHKTCSWYQSYTLTHGGTHGNKIERAEQMKTTASTGTNSNENERGD